MKIQYCSDLHLEFPENTRYLSEHKISPLGDVLILAGDITYLSHKHFTHPFFDYVSDHFENTYWIPGNHEFYGGYDLENFEKPVRKNIRHNVYLVNNIIESIHHTDFFFTTLWSKLDETRLWMVLNRVNDFSYIKKKGRVIQKNDFEYHHEQSMEFLCRSINKSKAAHKVVVTHHAPSPKCNAAEYSESPLNSAFVVNLHNFIHTHPTDYWIYGHLHKRMPVQKIGKTKLVANQLGYVLYGESEGFDLGAVIDL